MSAPAFRSAAAAQQGFGTSIATSLPTGWQAGDLLLLVVEWFDTTAGSGATITTPSGWTQLVGRQSGWGFVSGSFSCHNAIYYKIAGSSETAPTVAFNQNTTAEGVICAYSGVDGTTPVDGAATIVQSAATTSTPDAPAFTTTGANELLVDIVHDGRANGASSDITAAPSPETIDSNTIDGNPNSTAIAHQAVATAQTIAAGHWTATHVSVGKTIGIRLALNPSAGPAAQNTNAPFITAPTTLYTPVLTQNEPAPFISAGTTLFTPSLIADIANPYISAGTTVYTPTLSGSGIGTLLGQSGSISV